MPAVDISVSDNDGWQDANNLDLKLSGQGQNKLDFYCKTPFFQHTISGRIILGGINNALEK